MKGEARRIFNSASVAPEDCIFCKIVRRQLPANVVYEDGRYIAFLDINPFSKGHTLVCPKEHGETIWEMDEEDIGGLFMTASKVSRAVMAATGADGFRFLQNNGEAANQVVAHVHVHVIPVKLSDKGRLMNRISVPAEEMDEVGRSIRDALSVKRPPQ